MGDSKRISAMLVDDDVAYLEVLSFFLEREGVIETETVTSAKQALEILSQKEFDAIVSDYLMPEMDGLELLKIIRLQGKDIPFIMLTGRGREDVAIQALNCGADFYIQKGGDPKTQYTELSNMIRQSVLHRRAEKTVREGERFLEMLFKSIQDGVSVLSRDLVIEMVNPTIERWYASSMPLVGKKCYEAFRHRSEPCDVCPTMRTIRSGRTASERITKEGVVGPGSGWLDVYSFPVLNEQTGEVERVIEYLRDMTEEEQAKRALQENEKKYRALVDMANEGILAIESGGGITFANPRMAEMLGYETGDLLGMDIRSLVDSKSAGFVGPDWLHKALRCDERLELSLIRKDGSKIEVFMTTSALSGVGVPSDGIMAVVTDVTELRMVMDRLASSEERFAKVFQHSPQMMMVERTSDSTILEVNESFVRTTGFRRDQLLGRSCVDLGLVSAKVMEKLQGTLSEEGVIRDLEMEIGSASGESRLVNLSVHRMDIRGEQCTIFICDDHSVDAAGLTELRRERDVLKAVLDATPNGIAITDLEGNIVECNSAVEGLFAASKDGLIGMNVFVLLDRIDAAKTMQFREKLLTEGIVRDVVFKVPRGDGIVIDAEISVALVTDAVGNPLYIVGIVKDITDQLRYQANLREAVEARRQLVSIINQSPAVAFLWRAEEGWPVEYVSDNIQHFGYEAGELTSGVVSFASIVHPEDVGRVKGEVNDAIDRGWSELEQEYRLVSPEGGEFWIYSRVKVIRSRNGEVESLQGVIVDITDRKDAQERLSRTEKQLKMFIDMSPLVKFMKTRDGRYVYVNRKYQEALGVPSAQLIGKTDAEIFPAESASKLTESDRKVMETGGFHSFLEVVPQADGPHEYLSYKFVVPNVSGGEDLLAGTAVDLTEERRYERALKAANEKLNLLGSMTRHDIMNQLAVLVGWLEIVREDETDPVIAQHLKSMRGAADTIQSLLVFASEYQTVGAEKPAWIDVTQSFAEGIEGIPLVDVELEIEVQGLQVHADPMFGKVFRNLADNSIRHGEKVSRIRLHTRMEDDCLVLVYEDDGVGVPEDFKERIFEKGFGKHTGLGMFLIRQVLALTGMSIRETGTVGSGARFEIRVPSGGYRYAASKS